MEWPSVLRKYQDKVTADLVKSIHWALLENGPMDHLELLEALSRDSTLGFISLRTSYLQAKVKNCLEQMMQEPKPDLYFGYGGKIKISKGFEHSTNAPKNGLPYLKPWLQVGSGDESVYAIFSPSIMNSFAEAGLNKYPIKIGRTTRTIEQRLQELQTGSHLDLRLGIQILTNQSRDLEAKIHSQLSRMRVSSRNLSSEWFYSNMAEIRDLHRNEGAKSTH